MCFSYSDRNEASEPYSNFVTRYTIPVTDFFRFAVPLKRNLYLNHIDLYLIHTGSSDGPLTIDLLSSNKMTRYTVRAASISSDGPLRLMIEKEFFVLGSLSISIKVPPSCNIAICANEKGPCLEINGCVVKDYDLKICPIISIVTPLYKTNIAYLHQTLQSVIDQIYPRWELCLVDDGSGDPAMSKAVKKYVSDNPKIKFKSLMKNCGIAQASNVGLEMASGEYIGFLDHDDLLTPKTLLEIVEYINRDPEVDLIYTDEDKVNSEGRFLGPFYKPDWNYPMLLSQMYTCHFSIYRKSIVDKIGGLRKEYDGSQDYDFALRFIEKTKRIGHVPEILYHWRITEGSTSSSINNKPMARINAVRALQDHFKRTKVKAVVSAGPFQGHYRFEYVFRKRPGVTIIIPTRDNVDCLSTLIETMGITSYKNYRVIIMDNGSSNPETKRYLRGLSGDSKYTVIRYNKPFNFSAINNYAVKRVKDDPYVLFLNDDTEVMDHDWLWQMVQHFNREEVAAVGAKLLYLDHRIQHAGIFVGINGVAGHSHKYLWDWYPGYFSRPHIAQDITAVTAACMLVDRRVFLELGGFDTDLPRAFNDVDFCLKIGRSGKKIVYTPYARLYHKESVSRGLDREQDAQFRKAINIMERRWRCSRFKDPYYNPNLPNNCEGNSWIEQ